MGMESLQAGVDDARARIDEATIEATRIKVELACSKLGLSSARVVRVPSDYYTWTLDQRKVCGVRMFWAHPGVG